MIVGLFPQAVMGAPTFDFIKNANGAVQVNQTNLGNTLSDKVRQPTAVPVQPTQNLPKIPVNQWTAQANIQPPSKTSIPGSQRSLPIGVTSVASRQPPGTVVSSNASNNSISNDNSLTHQVSRNTLPSGTNVGSSQESESQPQVAATIATVQPPPKNPDKGPTSPNQLVQNDPVKNPDKNDDNFSDSLDPSQIPVVNNSDPESVTSEGGELPPIGAVEAIGEVAPQTPSDGTAASPGPEAFVDPGPPPPPPLPEPQIAILERRPDFSYYQPNLLFQPNGTFDSGQKGLGMGPGIAGAAIRYVPIGEF